MMTRSNTVFPLAFVLFLAMAISSCGPTSGRAVADPFGGGESRAPRAGSGTGSESRTVTVRVRNVNFMDATVYLSEPGRRRLGRVNGNETRSFSMSMVGMTTVRFRAELMGGTTCTTWYVEASPGDEIDLLIDSAVRPRRPNGNMSLCDAQRRRGRSSAPLDAAIQESANSARTGR